MSSGDRGEDPVKFTPDGAKRVLNVPFVKAFLQRRYRVSFGYDIPYVAGYSRSGEVIYIDRDLPRWLWRGQVLATTPFLVLHERVEKALLDAIEKAGPAGVLDDLIKVLRFQGEQSTHKPVDLYYHCHGVATAVEEHAVHTAYGTDGLSAYNEFMMKQVKRGEMERITRVPIDLDMTPYQGDDPMDKELRRVMNAHKQKPRGYLSPLYHRYRAK